MYICFQLSPLYMAFLRLGGVQTVSSPFESSQSVRHFDLSKGFDIDKVTPNACFCDFFGG